uniref:Uncharacterized protein n=1 Tax=Cacopsylla melanoneura TaxID=428564 RepID=A0A8D8VDJ1_9HEMI
MMIADYITALNVVRDYILTTDCEQHLWTSAMNYKCDNVPLVVAYIDKMLYHMGGNLPPGSVDIHYDDRMGLFDIKFAEKSSHIHPDLGEAFLIHFDKILFPGPYMMSMADVLHIRNRLDPRIPVRMMLYNIVLMDFEIRPLYVTNWEPPE